MEQPLMSAAFLFRIAFISAWQTKRQKQFCWLEWDTFKLTGAWLRFLKESYKIASTL